MEAEGGAGRWRQACADLAAERPRVNYPGQIVIAIGAPPFRTSPSAATIAPGVIDTWKPFPTGVLLKVIVNMRPVESRETLLILMFFLPFVARSTKTLTLLAKVGLMAVLKLIVTAVARASFPVPVITMAVETTAGTGAVVRTTRLAERYTSLRSVCTSNCLPGVCARSATPPVPYVVLRAPAAVTFAADFDGDCNRCSYV
jgi:hypothetical protein